MKPKTTRLRLILALILALAVASSGTAALAAPMPVIPSAITAADVDGTMNVAEGYTLAALQNTPTGFGDNNDATATSANGSELDGAYYMVDGSDLYVMLTGNLETNFNKLDIFIDSMAGGQNQLRGDNPDFDSNGLNRMGDDGGGNGLKFDAGFESDYFLGITNGQTPVETYANFSETPTGGGGTGGYIGGGVGSVVTGTNGIMVAINNSNTGGVDVSAVNTPVSVTTGIEIKIPLSVIGSPTGNIKVSAFINGSGHDFLSNQVLGGIGGGSNLGEPRNVDLSGVAGDQFFTISQPVAPSFCADLFFSEYIEASFGNNKALEIYNGTGSAVALDGMDYTIEYYNNGAVTPTVVYTLTGTIAFGDVLVLAPDQAIPEILAQADVAMPYPSVTHFNGDDALVLKKAGTIIDSIGRVGEDPGSEWGSGDVATKDRTIVRKPTVSSGDTDPSDAYDPAGGWNGVGEDTFTYLGSHTAECAGLQLLISEVVVTPTDGEFVEIYNPNSVSMDLSDVYLTDATFAGGSTYYYNIVTGSAAGGGSFSDFHARFPDGASIPAGAYQTVSLAGSDAFSSTYGSLPTYELFEDNASADAVPDMREATAGSINDQGGLSNGAEIVILYTWDGSSDLVTDLDYVNWGDKDEAVEKTGVSIDGPDPDSTTSTYLADTAIVSQTLVAGGGHTNGSSWQRKDMSEGAEVRGGGNGAAGHNETSEDLNNTFCENSPATPGAADNCPLPNPFGVCTDSATAINAVQSTGGDSPLAGTIVVLEGVVFADFQASTELSGYFLQEEDAQIDADATTSEGIFVYDNGFGTDVAVGDVVRVQGTVAENFGQTQLSSIMTATVCSSTGITVTPAIIDLPVADVANLEAFEGMLITVPETLYVTEHYNLGRFGEIWVSADAPLMNPTQVITPGTPAIDMQAANDKARLLIDDGSGAQNPATVPYIAPDNIVRGGDTLAGLTGALGYGFNVYRVQPTMPITFTQANTRTVAPAPVSANVTGTVKVAAFNVLNYFNGDGVGGGFPTSRGAGTPEEFDRQRTKIITALLSIDADIVGLMEIENDGYASTSAINDLVTGLNTIAGTGVYTYVNPGTPMWGTDAIAVAMIYKPSKVTPIGASAGITTGVFDQVTVSLNRQPLAQTFQEASNGTDIGGIVTVVVNHFKSKGSDCNDVSDPDAGDGQGNCNLTRKAAATELAAWLATDPTGSGDADFLVIGDLNSYAKEDPIVAMQTAGYTDLAMHFGGGNVYSYVFNGQWGTLDYAMSSSSLTSQVTGATIWHINADEVRALDYNDYNPAYVYGPDAYRSSDHDPVIVGLNLTPRMFWLPLIMAAAP